MLASWHPEPLDVENDANQLRELHKAFKSEWDALEGDPVQQLGASLKWIPFTLA